MAIIMPVFCESSASAILLAEFVINLRIMRNYEYLFFY